MSPFESSDGESKSVREYYRICAGCLLSLVLLAPLLVREWGLTPVVAAVVFYSSVVVPALTGYFSFPKLLLRLARSLAAVFLYPSLSAPCHAFAHLRLVSEHDTISLY